MQTRLQVEQSDLRGKSTNTSSWFDSWPPHIVSSGRLYTTIWALSLAVALSGMIGVGLGPNTRPAGYALLAIGGTTLALFALLIEIRTTPRGETGETLHLVVVATGGVTFVVATAFAANILWATPVPLAVRLVVLATAFQALLLTVDVRAVRRSVRARATMLGLSHGSIFAGSLFTLSWGPTVPRAGLVLYASGFASLLLNAFWARTLMSQTVPPKPETDRRRWEALLLGAVVVGILGAITMALSAQTGTLTLQSPERRILATMTGIAAIVALAVLGAPRWAPPVLRFLDGPVMTVAQHVLTLFVIVNGFLLGVFVAAPWLLPPVFGAFMLLLLVGVALNYGMLVHAWRRDRDDGQADPISLEDAEVTVVVTAMNEVDALSASLRENVSALAPLQFLLVPAARSTDGTQELMYAVQDDYPVRVRVVQVTGGSKAADLNAAWDHVETPYALILDADETVDPAFVTRALGILTAQPDIGIVQGRKVATDTDASRLSRFISPERQHSTWIDHRFNADVLAVAHFAGSAAVLRREVLTDVGGFSTDTLTEDIDLTVRLYLETDWDVAYVPEMVARELLPGTRASLFGQRERWTRGWAQVAGRHLSDVFRSWRHLGPRRSLGLSWVLFLALSAPVYAIFPALVLPTLALDVSLGLSLSVFVALTVFVVPERAVSFAYAVFHDPAISELATPRRIVETVAIAYLWIALGWILQFHSLYLQLAGAPQTWIVTRKAQSVVASPPADA